jgi:hypothetical protein
MASGYAKSTPYEDEHWNGSRNDKTLYVAVRFDSCLCLKGWRSSTFSVSAWAACGSQLANAIVWNLCRSIAASQLELVVEELRKTIRKE